MPTLSVRMLGTLQVQSRGEPLGGIDAEKAQELFCYLLLHRQKPHTRESLASLLWSECPALQSRKYLRKALWQLQCALDAPHTLGPLLVATADSIQICPDSDLWTDVAQFEDAFSVVQGTPGESLSSDRARTLQSALALYQGELLEGWYQDWCLFERERLENMYLAMLDKVMGYCEAHGEYEAGLACGELALSHDLARERTHQRLMRLHYLSGDRVSALHQFERCATLLKKELGVRPSKRTVAIYEQIRADNLDAPAPALSPVASVVPSSHGEAPRPLFETLARLEQLASAVSDIQSQIDEAARAIEVALGRTRRKVS